MNNITQNRNKSSTFYIPRLSEYAEAYSRVMRELKNSGASPGEIISFLKGTSDPPGMHDNGSIEVELEFDLDVSVPATPHNPPRQLYTAQKIARMLGIYSIFGRPHAHAVSAILNHNLILDDGLKEEHVLFETRDIIVYYTLYDEQVINQAADWIESRSFPYEIDGRCYTYYVMYR